MGLLLSVQWSCLLCFSENSNMRCLLTSWDPSPSLLWSQSALNFALSRLGFMAALRLVCLYLGQVVVSFYYSTPLWLRMKIVDIYGVKNIKCKSNRLNCCIPFGFVFLFWFGEISIHANYKFLIVSSQNSCRQTPAAEKWSWCVWVVV